VRDNLSKAERYRKLAVKYHELGKFAQPAYLGDFYRGVAVRYTFMAQEASERAEKAERVRHGANRIAHGQLSRCDEAGQDIQLLTSWAEKERGEEYGS
jgi:hypothetical protein